MAKFNAYTYNLFNKALITKYYSYIYLDF